MNLTNAGRKIAHMICRHSNWTPDGVTRFYQHEKVYSDRQNWISFLRVALLAVGMAFCAAGVFFFFAYNWAKMHPFVKLGLIQVVIVSLVVTAIAIKAGIFVKRILLTAASLMTGALFAVFGQIYQTGADAYDFFLGWTLFIAIWVFIADFSALWLVFITLINTTIFFFFEQDQNTWTLIARCNIHFAINMFATISFVYFGHIKKITGLQPGWLVQIISLVAVCSLTLGITYAIYIQPDLHTGIAVICLLVFYPAAIWYGMKTRSLFWIATICFSLIAIASALFSKLFKNDDGAIFLFTAAFIVGSTTFLIYQLLQLKKKWSYEN